MAKPRKPQPDWGHLALASAAFLAIGFVMGTDRAGGSTVSDPVAVFAEPDETISVEPATAEPAPIETDTVSAQNPDGEFDLSWIVDADPDRPTVNTGPRQVGEPS